MDASALSAAPVVATTVPRPNVSCETRSPGESETTGFGVPLLPGFQAPEAEPREAGGPCRVVTADEPKPGSSRFQSTSSSGTSSRNRDGGLKVGAPHAARESDRVR